MYMSQCLIQETLPHFSLIYPNFHIYLFIPYLFIYTNVIFRHPQVTHIISNVILMIVIRRRYNITHQSVHAQIQSGVMRENMAATSKVPGVHSNTDSC